MDQHKNVKSAVKPNRSYQFTVISYLICQLHIVKNVTYPELFSVHLFKQFTHFL